MKKNNVLSLPAKFTPDVKSKICKRDNHQCLFCKLKHHIENYNANSIDWLFHEVEYYVPGSKNGLGIEQNGFEICRHHQRNYNDPKFRMEMLIIVRDYLKSIYKDWNKENILFRNEEKRNEK
jgi:hypothetical protein